MDYAFKVTTNGRKIITACGALEKPLHITRTAVGSGTMPKGVNLADVHELYQYVTEGAISERRHENDHLYLTVQYANSEHKEQPTFTLSEFIVFAEHPETGEETDLLYATLGDYRQPVPAYRPGVPGSVFSYPLVTVVSDEIEVRVDAPPGIVTTDMLESAMSAIEEKLEEKTQIVAEGPPTPKTNGQPGQHYFDEDTGLEYICKEITEDGSYIWEEIAGGGNVHMDGGLDIKIKGDYPTPEEGKRNTIELELDDDSDPPPDDGDDSDLKKFLLAAHPVGSYYWSSKNTDPSELFGGTWEQIKDRFVLAVGDTYEAEASGGAATVTITTDQMPNHTHGSKTLTGSFTTRALNTNDNNLFTRVSGIITRAIDVWSGSHDAVEKIAKTDGYRETLTITATHEHASVGNGQAHENMPPYITAYCWKRIA